MSDTQAAEPQTIVVNADQYKQDLIRGSREEAASLGLDTTVPGGRYRVAGDDKNWYDANGQVIDESAKDAKAAESEIERLRAEVAELRAAQSANPGAGLGSGPNLEPGLGQSEISEEERARILDAERAAAESGNFDPSATVAELRAHADREGIDITGVANKPQLIERMNAHYAAKGAS